MLGTTELEGDDIEGLDAVVALDGLVSHEDIAPIEGLLDAATTAPGHPCGQVLVDAHRGLPLVGYDTEVLIERRAVGVLEVGDGFGIKTLDFTRFAREEEVFVSLPAFSLKEELVLSDGITTSHC